MTTASDHHHHFDSGAKSSELKPQYHLIPVEALRRLAARFKLGADHYGENNWRNGLEDPGFLGDRLNHAIEHLLLYANGDRSDDHLGAVACNVSMLLTADEMVKAKMKEAEVSTSTSTSPIDRLNTCKRCGHPKVDHLTYAGCVTAVTAMATTVPCGCPIFTPY